jgi:hypothetical protein
MADGALFIGWGTPVRGREQKALDVFGESIAHWAELQEEGAIEGFETYILEPHGGELAGFALLLGDPAKLAEVRARDDFQRMVARAGLIIENLGVVTAVTGEGLTEQMGVFAAQIAELT